MTAKRRLSAHGSTALILDQALLRQIEDYISRLDPQLQMIFRLHIYGNISFPEISASIGQSEAAVKSRYYRLLERLRKEFNIHDK